MGNCAGRPKTEKSDVPVPVPELVTKEVKVEQRVEEIKAEEIVQASEEKSLSTLFKENEEEKVEKIEAKKEEAIEEVKAEAAMEKTEAKEVAKAETTEEKPEAKAEN